MDNYKQKITYQYRDIFQFEKYEIYPFLGEKQWKYREERLQSLESKKIKFPFHEMSLFDS